MSRQIARMKRLKRNSKAEGNNVRRWGEPERKLDGPCGHLGLLRELEE
jgi:hypothetical protein